MRDSPSRLRVGARTQDSGYGEQQDVGLVRKGHPLTIVSREDIKCRVLRKVVNPLCKYQFFFPLVA